MRAPTSSSTAACAPPCRAPPLVAALAALRRLLRDERGAYWTFLVHTGTRILVGASPERHVSVDDGLVMMNPISGTFRHTGAGADRAGLLRFLADPKEVEELYMVLDEELKMMAAVAEHGGQVVGPYLKEMSHLAHTEYLLAGRGTKDVREVLRETMFAPDGDRQPDGERLPGDRPARAYRPALLLRCAGAARADDAGPADAGRADPDPYRRDLPRRAAAGAGRGDPGPPLDRRGRGRRDARQGGRGARRAGPGPQAAAVGPYPPCGWPTTREVRAALAARNAPLARFWLDQRVARRAGLPGVAGRRALVVDGEDTFTGMLAHQLRRVGPGGDVRPWHAAGPVDGYDLVVVGPGPGDPGSADRAEDARRCAGC